LERTVFGSRFIALFRTAHWRRMGHAKVIRAQAHHRATRPSPPEHSRRLKNKRKSRCAIENSVAHVQSIQFVQWPVEARVRMRCLKRNTHRPRRRLWFIFAKHPPCRWCSAPRTSSGRRTATTLCGSPAWRGVFSAGQVRGCLPSFDGSSRPEGGAVAGAVARRTRSVRRVGAQWSRPVPAGHTLQEV